MIRIYGASDDIVEIEGDVNEETSPGRSIVIGTKVDGGLVVSMKYGVGAAVWQARVRQIDEGIPVPWPVTIGNAEPHGFPDPQTYSVLVTIDCPAGTPVFVGKKRLSA